MTQAAQSSLPDPPIRRRRVEAASSPGVFQGDAAAAEQVKLMCGSADTVVRLRTVNPSLPKGDLNKSFEFEGAPTEVFERARNLNLTGHNVYVVAQITDPVPIGQFAEDRHVTAVRCLFADADGTALPDRWHLSPTFTLWHPTTKRWWAFWTTCGVELSAYSGMQRRIAAFYGTDPSISNLSRIVRLAGFDRWKDGKNHGPYELRAVA